MALRVCRCSLRRITPYQWKCRLAGCDLRERVLSLPRTAHVGRPIADAPNQRFRIRLRNVYLATQHQPRRVPLKDITLDHSENLPAPDALAQETGRSQVGVGAV
jgi:hypothetical protein